jgi:hypothetical protein
LQQGAAAAARHACATVRDASSSPAAQLRAFLDFHKIPYKVVEVNPLTKKELKWSTYGKARRSGRPACQRSA